MITHMIKEDTKIDSIQTISVWVHISRTGLKEFDTINWYEKCEHLLEVAGRCSESEC